MFEPWLLWQRAWLDSVRIGIDACTIVAHRSAMVGEGMMRGTLPLAEMTRMVAEKQAALMEIGAIQSRAMMTGGLGATDMARLHGDCVAEVRRHTDANVIRLDRYRKRRPA